MRLLRRESTPLPMEPFEALYKLGHQGVYEVEKMVAGTIGARGAIDYASKRPSELGMEDGPGPEKTLRHLLLSSELHRTQPSTVADVLLLGHEFVSGTLHGQDAVDRERDLRNNALGKRIGKVSKSRIDQEAWASEGQLRMDENTGAASRVLESLRSK